MAQAATEIRRSAISADIETGSRSATRSAFRTASLSKRTYVSVTTSSIAAGSSQTFYFYSQMLSANSPRPIRVVPIDTGIDVSGLRVTAIDRVGADAVNRQARVVVTNPTTSSVSGQTLYFFLEIAND